MSSSLVCLTSSQGGIDDEEDGVERVGATGVVVVVRRVRDEGDNVVVVIFGGTQWTSIVPEYLQKNKGQTYCERNC